MSGRARTNGVANDTGLDVQGSRREGDKAGWAGSIVRVNVPLVAENSGGKRGDLTRPECGNAGVSPEAHSAVGLRNHDGVISRRAHAEKRAAQCVFRAASVGGRAETRVAPSAGPDGSVGRIDHGIRQRFLVTDQRAVRRICAIDAWFPAGLPENSVPAKECQVHTGGPGSFNIGALSAGPIFVMPNGHEDFVLRDQRAVAVGIHAGEITEIVAVCFKPSKHRVFGIERPCVQIRHEWPVVTDFVCAAGRASRIKTVSTVLIVGLPIQVGRLHQNVRMAGVISNDKHDRALVASVKPREHGKIES